MQRVQRVQRAQRVTRSKTGISSIKPVAEPCDPLEHWPPKTKSAVPMRVVVWYARPGGGLPTATRGVNHASVSVLSTVGSSGKYSNLPAPL